MLPEKVQLNTIAFESLMLYRPPPSFSAWLPENAQLIMSGLLSRFCTPPAQPVAVLPEKTQLMTVASLKAL